MDKQDKRKANAEHRLNRLIELRDCACNGIAAEFGRKVGIAETYAVRMFWPIGTDGRKGVGPGMEATIREAFRLPPGWFDLPLGSALPGRNAVCEPTLAPYLSENHEESRLLRAFRLADPIIRESLLRQADWILESLENPLQLNGTDDPDPERA